MYSANLKFFGETVADEGKAGRDRRTCSSVVPWCTARAAALEPCGNHAAKWLVLGTNKMQHP